MSTATATETKKFTYTTNCTNANGNDVIEMKDGATDITRDTFLKYVDRSHRKTIEEELGYDKKFPMKNDWHVSYHKGTYRGMPCVFFTWSAIEYIFS